MNTHQLLISRSFFTAIIFILFLQDIQAQRRRTLEVESDEVDLDLNYIDYEISIQDKMNDQPLIAQVEVQDNNQVLLSDAFIKQTKSQFSFQLERESVYNITISAENYEDTTFAFDPNKVNEFFVANEIKLAPVLVRYKLDITDIETDDPLSGVNIMAISNNRDERLRFREDGTTGGYIVDLRASDSYQIEITDEGYFFASKVIDPNNITIGKDTKVRLTQLKPGSKVRLNNITFAKNSSELDQNTIKELERVAKILQDYPSLILEVAAHTDDKGSSEENMMLSENRAEVVYNFLLKFEGVDSSRLIPKAYGESQPIVPNDSEENRAINRRFELVVLEM